MRVTSILIGCILGTAAFGQEYFAVIGKAEDQYNQKHYNLSAELYGMAFKIAGGNRNDLYGAACSAALAGETVLAIQWLRQARDSGYVNIKHLTKDPDLNSLHKLRDWQPFLADMQRKIDQMEATYDKPLMYRLLKIHDDDQKYRIQSEQIGRLHGFESKEMNALWNKIERIDSLNLIRVKQILDSEGWVGERRVGSQASSALFLVIQHADLQTQQKYLPVMREAVKLGNAKASSLALLEDRVALAEKRFQTYGSQIGEDSTGKSIVLPLRDPDNVDKRRASVGLGPLYLYLKRWGITWNPSEYKTQLPSLIRQQGVIP